MTYIKNMPKARKECRITMEHILIVEDDRGLNAGLCRALKEPGRRTISCQSLQAAREQLITGSVSLVLLDISLPDGNGLTLLREIKEQTPQMPLILLTANDTDMDIVEGLEQGADDYITKPFSLAVLRARVGTQLRCHSTTDTSSVFVQGDYSFDFARLRFTLNGSDVELSRTEQKLLYLLTSNSGITLTRNQLTDRIWTDGSEFVDDNALSVTVKRLRDKLHAQSCIRTVYGIGYRWENGE